MPRSRVGVGARPRAPSASEAGAPSARFRTLDRYRATREWDRYEGTAQRELWRELRYRFLARHAVTGAWALDVGSGPGRFTPRLGAPGCRRVALDLSGEMLALLPERWEPRGPTHPVADRVRGDGLRPPFSPETFDEVALLGNALGFAGPESDRLWSAAHDLVTAGGTLIVEVAPGPGEKSRYLARLPASSVARLLRSPLPAVLPRVERESFVEMPTRRREAGSFLRIPAAQLAARFRDLGWEVRETLAVAPALGADAVRAEAARRDPKSWEHLLRLEEALGQRPERWEAAAAVLLAAVRPKLERSP